MGKIRMLEIYAIASEAESLPCYKMWLLGKYLRALFQCADLQFHSYFRRFCVLEAANVQCAKSFRHIGVPQTKQYAGPMPVKPFTIGLRI